MQLLLLPLLMTMHMVAWHCDTTGQRHPYIFKELSTPNYYILLDIHSCLLLTIICFRDKQLSTPSYYVLLDKQLSTPNYYIHLDISSCLLLTIIYFNHMQLSTSSYYIF